jgi:hypothetical protein
MGTARVIIDNVNTLSQIYTRQNALFFRGIIGISCINHNLAYDFKFSQADVKTINLCS